MYTVRLYSLVDIQDEVRFLLERGSLGRKSFIYELSKYFNDREWPHVESILEANEYLLRDRIIDLIGQESWLND